MGVDERTSTLFNLKTVLKDIQNEFLCEDQRDCKSHDLPELKPDT